MRALAFANQAREWERIPVDDEGYISAGELLAVSDGELRETVERAEIARYEGWRNHRDKWRRCLGLDTTRGKTILDFGCGLGLEALQFADAGNRVLLADINATTRELAQRVLSLFHYRSETVEVSGEWPYVVPLTPIDVFYANGVLHHTPDAPDILHRASKLLVSGGEVRLMLYSDRGWKLATQTEPPGGDPTSHPRFSEFVRFFDGVGDYAEPWWAEKLAEAAGPRLELVAWDYLTIDDRYAAARLRCV